MSLRTAPLGEIAKIERNTILPDEIKPGTTYVGLENIVNDGSFAGVRAVENGELASSKFVFSQSHILFGKLRPYLRKIARPDFDGICSTDILPILPGPKVERAYLYHYLRTPAVVDLATTRSSGANLPRISPTTLSEFQIPLPSLEEQRRIAEVLDRADALRQKRHLALQKLDTLFQSVFLEMFGDPVTNPKGWKVLKSGQLFSQQPRLGTTRKANGTGHLVVRVGEIGEARIRFSQCARVELNEAEFQRYLLCPGDTVIARAIGSKEQLGKSSYFDGFNEAVVVDSHVMRLRPDPNICDPRWFFALLSSVRGRALLQSKGGATAVQFNINTTQVSDLDIALPPIQMQRHFSKIAECIERQKALQADNLTKLDSIFASLQSCAFRGEIP